jgi:hypothetical protein
VLQWRNFWASCSMYKASFQHNFYLIPQPDYSSVRPRWLVPLEVLQPWRLIVRALALEVPACTARSPHAYGARDL